MRAQYLFFWGMMAIIIVTAISCEKVKSIAIGPESRIVVFADSLVFAEASKGINQTIAQTVRSLPQPESKFEIEYQSIAKFSSLKNRAYQLFLGSLNDSGPTSQFVLKILPEPARAKAESGEQNIFVVRNRWNDKQLSVFVLAESISQLNEVIIADSANFTHTFHEFMLERQYLHMYRRHSQPELEMALLDSVGFKFQMQHDYILVKADDRDQFVYFKRVQPDLDRWMWVKWWDVNGFVPDESNMHKILEWKDQITRNRILADDGAYVETFPDYFEQKLVNFRGFRAIETRGLWRLNDYSMGGPFINYTFYNDSLKQIFMINGTVLAPKFRSKRTFINEMEVIAKTFRYKSEIR